MNLTRGTYNVLRSVVVTVLVTVVALVALAYLLLLLPPVQQRLCDEGEKALGEFLNTEVNIGSVSISPFNQLELKDVLVNDQQGDSLLTIGKLGAGISLKDLVFDRRIVVTYGEIVGLNGHVTRPDKNSPTNMQFIIDAFKPKDDKPPKPFDVQVNTVVVRKSALTYDVLDQPQRPGRFDPNHLAIDNLRADLTLPRLKNNDFDIRVKRLSFDEASGFSLKRLSTDVHITDNALDVKDIKVQLPNSDIRLDDVHLTYSSLKNLGNELKDMPLRLSTPGSTVAPSDLAAFVPQLAQYKTPMTIATTVVRDGNRIEVPNLNLQSTDGALAVNARGGVTLPTGGGYHALDLDKVDLKASSGMLSQLTGVIPGLTPQARYIISHCGNVNVNGELHSTPANLSFNGHVGSSLGNADLNAKMKRQGTASHIAGHVKTDGLQLGTLLEKNDLVGQVAMDAQIDAVLNGRDVSGKLQGHIPFIDFRGTRYHDITADIDKQGNGYTGALTMNDPNVRIQVDGKALIDGAKSNYDVNIKTDGLNLARLGITDKYADHRLSTTATVSFWGNSLDNASGVVELNDFAFTDAKGEGLKFNNLKLLADNNGGMDKIITIESDHVDGFVSGQYDFHTIVPTVKHMLSNAFPKYFGDYADYTHKGEPNDVRLNLVITPDESLHAMHNLPFKLAYRTVVEGELNESDSTFNLVMDAPLIIQGNKVIERTLLSASLDNETDKVVLNVQSSYPAKKGMIDLNLDASGQDNRIGANLSWCVPQEHDFHGNINLGGLLDRGEDGGLKADIDIHPSQLVFNDTIWGVEKGHIGVENGVITVENLSGGHGLQFLQVNGKISKDPDDELCLEMNDLNLDYVFGTLAIDNVDFGGRATTKVYASDLLSGSPRIYTPSFAIKNVSYNDAVLGDLDFRAEFDTKTRGILVNGGIDQPNGRRTDLDGGIYVADDSLYIEFDTDHANVAFLKPYMSAFTSDVQGEMSGKATLFGNFHTINLEGDIVADSIRFLLDYVNCYYTASDVHIHVIPDFIEFSDIPIHDREGHEAKLGGWLKHDAFHRPEFNFAITDAHNFLSYDTNPSINPDWYGTIYGNGACFVDGGPGIVNISVKMTSAPRSKFTLVMNDTEQVDNYNFITFRDREAPLKSVVAQEQDSVDLVLSQLKKQVQQEVNTEPSAYNIDLQGDITPDLALTVIMDPVGGDRIKATGSGHMRLTYNNNGELGTYGKYTLDKGTYNFTLQDVIIKDFTIREGSSISFQGDPYAAILDLEAAYALNANIRDLDESFADDAIARANVPVHALLRAKGIISQPEISFDLEFPSLTTETYRKVKSIISTDEMMNRQIIYLLALNRFYTPEYMLGSTTANQNEFITSVASSTIAGQLSNILGKMTDNLSIAPNVRTRDNFNDVEVDVALSSQLLNNRLLLNGNFGYRENTYSTSNTNFIGDFDLEYLLNSRGTFRLKAYNHFNDQSYYRLNTPLTTQGVGIVWKHDFDKPKRKANDKTELEQGRDSIPVRVPSQPSDSRDSSVRQPVPMVTLRPAAQHDKKPSTAP
ncbi:MAG: translocation/assembly module TamB domain-containing protein [Muribaculaceae bacterium]|nr:translocation/assembly module TamB domain-containing protein [Muribaculaceae bacterium]